MKNFVTKYSVLIPIAALITLLAQGDFFSRSPLVIAGQVLAVGVAVWARVAFRHSEFRAVANPGGGQLVRGGPYRLIRHPMYAGVSFLIIVSAAGHISLLNAAIALVVVIVVLTRVSIEERLLKLRYPEYEAYSRETKRLIPFVY
jgi:protein-S-isoprenylcysteine O-methyltransferase Ste14